jgi:predicted N-acetyltransferase YhbS
MVARDDKSVVGHVGIVIREIRCGDLHVKVAGVQSLGVVPEWRGTGLAQQLMVFAMKQAMSRPLSFGLLFCVPELERFYGSLGWVRTDQRPSMLDERGMVAPLPEHNIAMFMELAGTKFPGGPIDLQGRDW